MNSLPENDPFLQAMLALIGDFLQIQFEVLDLVLHVDAVVIHSI